MLKNSYDPENNYIRCVQEFVQRDTLWNLQRKIKSSTRVRVLVYFFLPIPTSRLGISSWVTSKDRTCNQLGKKKFPNITQHSVILLFVLPRELKKILLVFLLFVVGITWSALLHFIRHFRDFYYIATDTPDIKWWEYDVRRLSQNLMSKVIILITTSVPKLK